MATTRSRRKQQTRRNSAPRKPERHREARIERGTQGHLWIEPSLAARRRDPWLINTRTRECGRRGVNRARHALDHAEPEQLTLSGVD